jgi:hypothetical protein
MKGQSLDRGTYLLFARGPPHRASDHKHQEEDVFSNLRVKLPLFHPHEKLLPCGLLVKNSFLS